MWLGSEAYCGVVVLLVLVFAGVSACRRHDSRMEQRSATLQVFRYLRHTLAPQGRCARYLRDTEHTS